MRNEKRIVMTDNHQALNASRLRASKENPWPHDQLKVMPSRYYGRWISMLAIAALIGLVGESMVTNQNFGWATVGKYLFSPTILSGLATTSWLTLVIMLLAIVLGVVIAVMRLSSNPLLVGFSGGWIWFFRGTPVLVQLIFWYNLAVLYPTVTVGIPGVFTLWQGSMNDLITLDGGDPRAGAERVGLYGGDYPRGDLLGG